MNTTTVSRDEILTGLLNALDPDPWAHNLGSALHGVIEFAGNARTAIQSGDIAEAASAARGLREEAASFAEFAVWLAETLATHAEADSIAEEVAG